MPPAVKYLVYILLLLLCGLLLWALIYLSSSNNKARKREKFYRTEVNRLREREAVLSAYQRPAGNHHQALTEYRRLLQEAESIDTCPKVPASELMGDQNYVFISYSHKDYKAVYSDLANLQNSGVRFWYDEGLTAGQVWHREVQQHLSDPNCSGVIFYMSENLFTSPSVLTELKAVYGNKPYFAVNLTDRQPSEILKNCIGNIQSQGDTMEWLHYISGVFQDATTYLTYQTPDHDKTLIKQIRKQFNVTK